MTVSEGILIFIGIFAVFSVIYMWPAIKEKFGKKKDEEK